MAARGTSRGKVGHPLTQTPTHLQRVPPSPRRTPRSTIAARFGGERPSGNRHVSSASHPNIAARRSHPRIRAFAPVLQRASGPESQVPRPFRASPNANGVLGDLLLPVWPAARRCRITQRPFQFQPSSHWPGSCQPTCIRRSQLTPRLAVVTFPLQAIPFRAWRNACVFHTSHSRARRKKRTKPCPAAMAGHAL